MLVTQSCPTLCNPWTVACQAPLSMEFSRQEYRSRRLFPSPGIFQTQGLNPGLLHCKQTLYYWATWGALLIFSIAFSRISGGSVIKNLPANAGDVGWIPVSGRSLEKERATHYNTLAWEIPWTEEFGRLQSMRSTRAWHDWMQVGHFYAGTHGILWVLLKREVSFPSNLVELLQSVTTGLQSQMPWGLFFQVLPSQPGAANVGLRILTFVGKPL